MKSFAETRVSRKWFDRLSYYRAREYPIDSGATDSSTTIDTNCVKTNTLCQIRFNPDITRVNRTQLLSLLMLFPHFRTPRLIDQFEFSNSTDSKHQRQYSNGLSRELFTYRSLSRIKLNRSNLIELVRIATTIDRARILNRSIILSIMSSINGR